MSQRIELPTLYARSETGSILEWDIIVDDNTYFTISGQQTGKKITSEITICQGKNTGKANETTPEEQALAEAEAKWKKKLKSGGYWEDIADIDKSKFFQVMLAKSFADYKNKIDWAEGVGVQIKYNGGRVIATKDGLFSRKGERYVSVPHIEKALVPFFTKFPNAVLDGEGFNYDLRDRLNEIMKLLRKTVHITDDDLKQSGELIRFYVYDGFGFPASKDGPVVLQTDDYLKRKAAIDNAFFAPCFAERYKNIIGKVPTWIVHSEKELQDLYLKFLDDKQEGAILRILNKPYENKRTNILLKYKPIDDAEFEVVSVQDGDGKFANRIATLTCRRLDGGTYADNTNTFDATFKGEDVVAIRMWQTKDDLLGKTVTIHFNGVTGKGKPNYARFDCNNYLHDK